MKSLLTYQVNGIRHTMEFDSPSDAINYGLGQMLAHEGLPISVTYNNKTVATQDDFYLLWEEALKQNHSTFT